MKVESRQNLHIALVEGQIPSRCQESDRLREIARPILQRRIPGLLPLCPLQVDPGVGKHRFQIPRWSPTDQPSGVVEMKMGQDEVGDRSRIQFPVRLGNIPDRKDPPLGFPHNSPIPQSIRIRRSPRVIHSDRVTRGMQFSSSGSIRFDQRLRGTEPNMQPPSRRNRPKTTSWTVNEPKIIGLDKTKRNSVRKPLIRGGHRNVQFCVRTGVDQ